MTLRKRWRRRWRGPGGTAEVLTLAYPLILSQMSFTLQTFIDRLFLTWHSAEAIAGATGALFVVWTLIAVCTGTGEYVTTFVAQYLGAGRPHRVGPVVWQGIYFAFLSGAAIAALSVFVPSLFHLAGHDPLLQEYEVTYARLLMWGAFPLVLMPTLASFFAGRGETRTVLAVNLVVLAANAILDYLWIFGRGGFAPGGVAGAASATVVAHGLGALLFMALVLRPAFRSRFATLAGWRFQGSLFRRLLRFGVPAGLQYGIELLAFALFTLIIGRLGTVPLAATGIALNLNMIVFMPMVGLGLGVSAIVGRYMGRRRAGLAERATWSAFQVSLGYMGACAALYLLAPGWLLAPFAAGAEPSSFEQVEDLCVVLLRYVALYSVFDMMNVIFAAGLRGAGDTVYPLGATLGVSWLVMLLPTFVGCIWLGAGTHLAWSAASGYIFVVGLIMLRRFRAGRWKRLSVIEHEGEALLTRVVS